MVIGFHYFIINVLLEKIEYVHIYKLIDSFMIKISIYVFLAVLLIVVCFLSYQLLTSKYDINSYLGNIILIYSTLIFSNLVLTFYKQREKFSLNKYSKIDIRIFLKNQEVFNYDYLLKISVYIFIIGIFLYIISPIYNSLLYISSMIIMVSTILLLLYLIIVYYSFQVDSKKYILSMFSFYSSNKELIKKIHFDVKNMQEILKEICRTDKFKNMCEIFKEVIYDVEKFKKLDDDALINKAKIKKKIITIYTILYLIINIYSFYLYNIFNLNNNVNYIIFIITFSISFIIYIVGAIKYYEKLITKIKSKDYLIISYRNEKIPKYIIHPYSNYLKEKNELNDLKLIYNNIHLLVKLYSIHYKKNNSKDFSMILNDKTLNGDCIFTEFILYSICLHLSSSDRNKKSLKAYQKLNNFLFEDFKDKMN